MKIPLLVNLFALHQTIPTIIQVYIPWLTSGIFVVTIGAYFNDWRAKMRATKMHQMFVVSDLLLRLGYRNAALLIQRSAGWEFIHDFIALIVKDAQARKDSVILNRLAMSGLYGTRSAA